MGQGIQTIGAANVGIEKATSILEQMTSITEQASLYAIDYQVEVKAIVSTKEELLSAIQNTDKGAIVITKDIDMGNTTLELQDGQHLISEHTLLKNGNVARLNWSFEGTENEAIGIRLANQNVISDLNLYYDIKEKTSTINSLIYSNKVKTENTLSDVNLSVSCHSTDSIKYVSGISTSTSSVLNLQNNVSIDVTSDTGAGSLFGIAQGKTIQQSESKLNINIDSEGWRSVGISNNHYMISNSSMLIEGTGAGNNVQATIEYEKNCMISLLHNRVADVLGSWISTKVGKFSNFTNTLDGNADFNKIAEFPISSFDNVINDIYKDKIISIAPLSVYSREYANQLINFDSLIGDANYQGKNLLRLDNLKVNFSKNHNLSFLITGVDISTNSMGLEKADWFTLSDVEKSREQILNAKQKLRDIISEFATCYSVITTRINFTEGLSDILQTGADDLTLADMNEASAQYLSLETRQQLAINSLSLASMSARSILSLFC